MPNRSRRAQEEDVHRLRVTNHAHRRPCQGGNPRSREVGDLAAHQGRPRSARRGRQDSRGAAVPVARIEGSRIQFGNHAGRGVEEVHGQGCTGIVPNDDCDAGAQVIGAARRRRRILEAGYERDSVVLGVSMSSEAIVRVVEVHKFFTRGSEQIDVLNGLNLDVPEGEFLALMGPSGSGKTTLLNLIAGLDQPSAGEIWGGGEPLSHMSEAQLAGWRTRHVGFIFQFYQLLSVLTAYENVELPLLLLPLSASQRRAQVLTALELVGLTDRMKHRPGQLSGGQQRRGGIARALVTDPTLIVADEPTGDLDAHSAE